MPKLISTCPKVADDMIPVPNDIFRRPHAAQSVWTLWVYLYDLTREGGGNSVPYPSLTTQSRTMNIARSTVVRATRWLEDRGWLTRTEDQDGVTYVLGLAP